MPSIYNRISDGVNFDDIFEPRDSGDPELSPRIYRDDGVNLSDKYAPRAVGPDPGEVGYKQDGGDIGLDFCALGSRTGSLGVQIDGPSTRTCVHEAGTPCSVSATLSSAVSGGEEPYSYAWDVPVGLTITQGSTTSESITVEHTGEDESVQFQIGLTVTDDFSNEETDTHNITFNHVDGTPHTTLDGDSRFSQSLSGQSTTVFDNNINYTTVDGLSGNYSYLWEILNISATGPDPSESNVGWGTAGNRSNQSTSEGASLACAAQVSPSPGNSVTISVRVTVTDNQTGFSDSDTADFVSTHIQIQ